MKPRPMRPVARRALGAGLLPLCAGLYAVLFSLWPVPSIDRGRLRAELAQAQTHLAAIRASDAPDAAREQLAAKEAAELEEALRAADEQFTEALGGRVVIPREWSYLAIAIAMGAMGSLLHAARSFAGYAGNRRLLGSWGLWYLIQPFVGATLALLFYAGLRGGLLSGPNSISPWGVAALSGLAGMFSKQATDKLNEIFSLLLRTSADEARKDKM